MFSAIMSVFMQGFTCFFSVRWPRAICGLTNTSPFSTPSVVLSTKSSVKTSQHSVKSSWMLIPSVSCRNSARQLKLTQTFSSCWSRSNTTSKKAKASYWQYVQANSLSASLPSWRYPPILPCSMRCIPSTAIKAI